MNVMYQSTRGGESNITASKAILQGLACDGGLFMPDHIPTLDKTIEELAKMSYQDTAYEIMKLFFSDFTEAELRNCIENAYDEKFDVKEIAPLVKVNDLYFLELFHGSTIAFKDMALSILPHLMTTAAKKNQVNKKIVILTATSGDTGKAAMAGFADVEGTEIIVFYPKNGVSKVQELQMVTQKGDNTHVVAIHGNFDDAQSGVKKIFADKEFETVLDKRGIQFSSANSINIGRLVPQIVYYVYAYVTLVANKEIENGELVNIAVPTGNFGNILAGFLAKQLGIPIKTLICASNDNKVLFDFFETGVYDRKRDFLLTNSPSMDILISSNLERLIYLSTGGDPTETRRLMDSLNQEGSYSVTDEMKAYMRDFVGGYATESENSEIIKQLFEDTGYMMDTHTGVACAVYDKYKKEESDKAKTIIVSTASPYKFSRSVIEAVYGDQTDQSEFELIEKLHEVTEIEIPQAIEEIRRAEVRHQTECEIGDMKATISDLLGL